MDTATTFPGLGDEPLRFAANDTLAIAVVGSDCPLLPADRQLSKREPQVTRSFSRHKLTNNKTKHERKNVNTKFDEPTKGMAQSVTRRRALKKLGVGRAGRALAKFG